MNGYFKEVIITKQGLEMLKEVLGKKGKIEFTKISLGKGREKNSIIELENVVDKVMDIPIKISIENSNTYKIIGLLDNKNVQDAFLLTEMGVYAKIYDGEEVLFSYTYTENGEYIPTASEVKFVREFSFDTTIAQSSNIELIVDDSNIYATQEDLRYLDNKFSSGMEDLEKGSITEIKQTFDLNDYSKYPLGHSLIVLSPNANFTEEINQSYGTLITFNARGNIRCSQLWFGTGQSTSQTFIKFRHYYNGKWTEFKEVANKKDIEDKLNKNGGTATELKVRNGLNVLNGYLTINSFKPTLYGEGSSAIWYSPNSKQLTFWRRNVDDIINGEAPSGWWGVDLFTNGIVYTRGKATLYELAPQNSYSSSLFRKSRFMTSDPSPGMGEDGDICFIYEE